MCVGRRNAGRSKSRLETVLECDPHHAFALVEYAKIMQRENVIPLAQNAWSKQRSQPLKMLKYGENLGNVFHIQNQTNRAVEVL